MCNDINRSVFGICGERADIQKYMQLLTPSKLWEIFPIQKISLVIKVCSLAKDRLVMTGSIETFNDDQYKVGSLLETLAKKAEELGLWEDFYGLSE